MCRWCSLAALLCCALSGAAEEPTPEAPWFAVDFSQPWQDAAGTWSVPPPDATCDWTAAAARLAFAGLTNATVAFTPAEVPARGATTVEATMTLVDASLSRKLPDIPAARGALAVVELNHRPVYVGWTADGWVELAGATPAVDRPTVCKIAFDDTVSPPRVSYAVDGRWLAAASNADVSAFATADTGETPRVELYGAGEISSLAGSRELAARQAAVVRPDGSFDYHADLAEACGAATNGAEVLLLRRVEAMDWTATANGVPLRLAARLANARLPIFTLAEEPPPDARLPLDMPPGTAVDCLLFSAADAAAGGAVHVHGDPATVYTLSSGADGVRLRSGSLPLDIGGFVGYLAVAEGDRAFVGGLLPGDLGSRESLYVQGGDVTLCGTNAHAGATVVESGTLTLCGQLTRSAVQVWERGTYAGPPVTNGVFTVEGHARVDAPLAGTDAALADGASLAFDLDVAENGMILVPRAALPAGGGVAVSVAVRGRFEAFSRTTLSGDVVAAVAAAPELAARQDAFTVAEGRATAVVANATTGFWYGWEAADEATGPFKPAGEAVKAVFDGELEISLAEPPRPRRFYRLRVTAAP